MEFKAYERELEQAFCFRHGRLESDRAACARAGLFWNKWRLFVALMATVDTKPMPAGVVPADDMLRAYTLALAARERARRMLLLAAQHSSPEPPRVPPTAQ